MMMILMFKIKNLKSQQALSFLTLESWSIGHWQEKKRKGCGKYIAELRRKRRPRASQGSSIGTQVPPNLARGSPAILAGSAHSVTWQVPDHVSAGPAINVGEVWRSPQPAEPTYWWDRGLLSKTGSRQKRTKVERNIGVVLRCGLVGGICKVDRRLDRGVLFWLLLPRAFLQVTVGQHGGCICIGMRGIRGNSEAAGGCRETMGWQRVNMGSPTGADTYNTCGRLVIAILSKYYLGSRQGCQHLQTIQDY